jgi:hypothetical protein
MKLLGLVLATFVFTTASAQQQPNPQAETSGTCSPIIQSNQGKVEFTCNTRMDEATTKKIVSLLNAILKNTNDRTDTDKKLDDIMDFLQKRLPADWHLAPDQKESLKQIADSLPSNIHVQVVRVNETNSIEFGLEIYQIFESAGKATLKDLLTGLGWTGGGVPHGVLILIRDKDDAAFPFAQKIGEAIYNAQHIPMGFHPGLDRNGVPIEAGLIKIIVGVR